MTIHIVVDEGADTAAIRSRINAISKEYHIIHTTVEFETESYNCEMNCDIES